LFLTPTYALDGKCWGSFLTPTYALRATRYALRANIFNATVQIVK